MTKIVNRANVKLVSDGSLQGTKIVFVREDGIEENIVPVTAATWHFDVDMDGTQVPVLTMSVLLGQADLHIPLDLVELVKEPRFTIEDHTPIYARMWLWVSALKRR